MPGTLLAKAYPTADEWKLLVESFSSDAIAHKLLLAHVPYVFRNEPAKFAVFRRVMADAFNVESTAVFIVGSAMAGRSLKGKDIEKEYSAESDIDALIISEPLFTTLLMDSLEWVASTTKSRKNDKGEYEQPKLSEDTLDSINKLSQNAVKGIWRPDSLPKGVKTREDFFGRFERVSLHTLGLQLSEDTVAHVNGRVARSFEDAVSDLGNSIYRLKLEFREIAKKHKRVEESKNGDDSATPAATTTQATSAKRGGDDHPMFTTGDQAGRPQLQSSDGT
jgi:hypothetical protein